MDDRDQLETVSDIPLSETPALRNAPKKYMPDHEPFYHKSFWGAYKGHVMGMLRGVFIGAIAGAAIAGVALFAIPAAATAIATLAGASVGTLASLSLSSLTAGGIMGVLPFIAAFAASGGLMGGHILGNIGTAAGNAATLGAEEELRTKYPDYRKEMDSKMLEMGYGYGHHYEYPPDRDRGKLFHMRTGFVGGAIGGGLGAISGYALSSIGALMNYSVVHGAGLIHSIGAGTAVASGGLFGGVPLIAAYSAAALGLFGMSFGINRGLFKSFFNWTDGLFEGNVLSLGKRGIEKFQNIGQPDLPEEDLSYEKIMEKARKEGRYVPNGFERQEELNKLSTEYFDLAFWEGLAGNQKGLVGGMLLGALIAGTAGIILATAFPVLGAPLIVSAAAGAIGSAIGAEIFTSAGYQAGAHASVQEALETKRSLGMMQNPGLAPDGISKAFTPETKLPPPKHSDKFFNIKRGGIAIVVSALLGAIAAPTAGAGLVAMLGIEGLKGAALVGAQYAASIGTYAAVGSTFLVTLKPFKMIANFADMLYKGTHKNEMKDGPELGYTPELPVPGKTKDGISQEQAAAIPSVEPMQGHNNAIAAKSFRGMVAPDRVAFHGPTANNQIAMENYTGRPATYEDRQHLTRELARRQLPDLDVTEMARH